MCCSYAEQDDLKSFDKNDEDMEISEISYESEEEDPEHLQTMLEKDIAEALDILGDR